MKTTLTDGTTVDISFYNTAPADGDKAAGVYNTTKLYSVTKSPDGTYEYREY